MGPLVVEIWPSKSKDLFREIRASPGVKLLSPERRTCDLLRPEKWFTYQNLQNFILKEKHQKTFKGPTQKIKILTGLEFTAFLPFRGKVKIVAERQKLGLGFPKERYLF